MNEFSKKTNNTLLTISIIALFFSTIMVLFSTQFIDIAYSFLQKALHRNFSLEKWRSSIESFFLIPAFLVISIDSLIFIKFREKSKYILLFILLADSLFMITYTNAATAFMQACSDDASELLLGKECIIEKTILPINWYYSTEIRFLNTQIFSALAWIFTDNFTTVKTIQSFLTVCAFFITSFYLMTVLEIKKKWVKILCSTLLILPWSAKIWWVGAGFNYYIPHAIFSFIYTALFIKLIQNHSKKIHIFFGLIAFISGLTSIRYILNFVIPLLLAVSLYEGFTKKENPLNIKKFWIENDRAKFALGGFILSALGYAFNNIVLQKIFDFAEWNTMSYNSLGSTTLSDIFRGIIHLFGYVDNIAVFTPNGVINILVYFFLIMFAVMAFCSLKTEIYDFQKIFIIFSFAAIIQNSWIYIHVDYTERYFYPIIASFLPCIAIIIDNHSFTFTKRYILGVLSSIVLLMGSFSTIQGNFAKDENKKRLAAAQFLENSGYEFGYGTFAQSTIFTWLTHGKVTVGMLKKEKEIPYEHFFYDEYKHGEWDCPKWYYTNDWGNKPIFFIASKEEHDIYNSNKLFHKGRLVYHDDYYYIFEYNNHEEFKHLYDEQ